jgi:hypothetical protein
MVIFHSYVSLPEGIFKHMDKTWSSCQDVYKTIHLGPFNGDEYSTSGTTTRSLGNQGTHVAVSTLLSILNFAHVGSVHHRT